MKYLILSLLLLTAKYQFDAAELRIYETIDSYVNISLDTPRDLLAYVNTSLTTVFYTFGFDGSPNGETVTIVLKALLNAYERYNVALLDWSKEASVNSLLGIDLSYVAIAIPNAEAIGCRLGTVMVDLIETNDGEGLDPDKIVLVGHSLGAHLWGQTGRCAKGLGYEIPLIIGLDPAGPGFAEDFTQLSVLDKSCASFVQILHTDLNNYGHNKSTGHVDIYPNFCVTTNCVQPGCPVGTFTTLNTQGLCSHDRAPRLFSEALQCPNNLLALGAPNYYDWIAFNGNGDDITQMGLEINFGAYGNYYCSTNGSPPYGKETAGLRP